MTHPRWLDEEQQRTWRAYLAANRLVSERIERRLQAEAGMPQAYYEILVRLSEAPANTLRMSVLAESSMSSRSRVSHAVARMEESGWIRRRSCPTDRRGQLAELTDEGLRVLRETAPGHATTVQEVLFDGLSPQQQEALRDVGEALVAHLSAGAIWPVDGDETPDGAGCAETAAGAEGCRTDAPAG